MTKKTADTGNSFVEPLRLRLLPPSARVDSVVVSLVIKEAVELQLTCLSTELTPNETGL